MRRQTQQITERIWLRACGTSPKSSLMARLQTRSGTLYATGRKRSKDND